MSHKKRPSRRVAAGLFCVSKGVGGIPNKQFAWRPARGKNAKSQRGLPLALLAKIIAFFNESCIEQKLLSTTD